MKNNMRILVVDDDIDLLEQVTITLTDAGYDVLSAASQEEGEGKLLEGRPDLAILDLMMEQMDSGFVLCHEVKRLYPGTPVIIFSAVTSSTGLNFAATDAKAKSWIKAEVVLNKPIRPDRLLNEVARLLHSKSDLRSTTRQSLTEGRDT